jgi:hypothetical protein
VQIDRLDEVEIEAGVGEGANQPARLVRVCTSF